jgi:hypothetical protein
MAAHVAVFTVEDYAADVTVVASLDGRSFDIEDPGDGPHYEIEATVVGATSRKEALEAVATKILREIADYG